LLLAILLFQGAMAWISSQDVKPKSAQNGMQAWLSSMFGDVECCTSRDQSKQLSKPGCRPSRRPGHDGVATRLESSALEIHAHLANARSHFTEKGQYLTELFEQSSGRAAANSLQLTQPAISVSEVSDMPPQLPAKVAGLIRKDPFVLREIWERSAESSRLLFLKHAVMACDWGAEHDKIRCMEIWATLDDQDRADLKRSGLLGHVPHGFHSSICEPDYQAWKRAVSSECDSASSSDLEVRSDSTSR
jgi:hypothetical protein